jgi:hypothetical protein
LCPKRFLVEFLYEAFSLALFVLAAAVATTTALTPSAMRVFMKKVTDDCEEKLGDKESSIARVECIREGRKKLIRRFAARDVKEEEEEEITWNEKVFKEAKLAKENDESLNCAAAAKDICDHRHWKLHELKGESRDKFEKRQKEKCNEILPMYEDKDGKQSKTGERTLKTLLKACKNQESVKSACKRFFSAAAGCEAAMAD